MALNGHLALVAARSAGLRIFDVSDPAAPVELSGLPTMSPATCVATSGRWAWVGAHPGQGRMWLVDISDPSTPVEWGALDLPTTGLAAEGDTSSGVAATCGSSA